MTALTSYPATVITAGEARRMTGATGDLLRMHDGAVYIHITPEIAAQWLPLIQSIANEKSN